MARSLLIFVPPPSPPNKVVVSDGLHGHGGSIFNVVFGVAAQGTFHALAKFHPFGKRQFAVPAVNFHLDMASTNLSLLSENDDPNDKHLHHHWLG